MVRHDVVGARAEQLSTLSALPVANQAGCLLKLGRTAEAEAAYRTALKLNASVRRAAPNLARMPTERGALSDARAVLDASIAAGGRFPESYLERGTVRARAGDLAGAFDDFQEAARRAPTDLVALDDSARAAYQLRKPREAAIFYERLVALAPGRTDAWKTLGAIQLYELSDRPAALPSFRRALSLEADPSERSTLKELLRTVQD